MQCDAEISARGRGQGAERPRGGSEDRNSSAEEGWSGRGEPLSIGMLTTGGGPRATEQVCRERSGEEHRDESERELRRSLSGFLSSTSSSPMQTIPEDGE